MAYKLDFEIPCQRASDLPRNLNNSLHAVKYFTWERAKWRRLIAKYVYARPSNPLAKASLVLERHGLREPDYDGLVTSFKFVIDGLVHAGVIKDDKMSVIGIPDYRWIKAKKGMYKIRIVVQELAMGSEASETKSNSAHKKANNE